MIADRQAPAEPMLYTRRQVAGLLNLCEKSVWQLTRDGRLPVVHVTARAVRYDRRDVERFILSAKSERGGP